MIDIRGGSVRYPAAVFVSKQLELMRTKGLSEDGAYQRLMMDGWNVKLIKEMSDKHAGDKGKKVDDDKEQKGTQQFNAADQYALSLRSAYDEYLAAERKVWEAFAEFDDGELAETEAHLKEARMVKAEAEAEAEAEYKLKDARMAARLAETNTKT